MTHLLTSTIQLVNEMSDQEPLPMNLDAERLILGAALTEEGSFARVAACLAAEDFALQKHQLIYARMAELHERGERLDRIALTEELQKHRQLDSVDGFSYIISLDDGMPQVHNLDGYVRIVREKAVLRRAIYGARSLISKCLLPEASTEVVEQAERFYRELAGQQLEEEHLLRLGEYLAQLDEQPGRGLSWFLDPHSQEPAIGVPWPSLSELLAGGFRIGELITIAGRPSHGKSACAAQLGHHAAATGKGVLLFSLEMAAAEIWRRLICAASETSLQKWRKGKLNLMERQGVTQAVDDISGLPLWISDHPHCSIPVVQAAMQRHRAAGQPLDLVIVDYLQLMASTKAAERRAQEVAEIARQLKLLAKEYSVPIVMLSQVRRYQDEDTRAPNLASLKESGAIEEASDVVMFCWQRRSDREKSYKEKQPCPTRLEVAKQRNGPAGGLALRFNIRFVRLEEEMEAGRGEGETI